MIRLSSSSLNLLRDCPRCFWIKFNGTIERPSGPFPSLPGGMDNIIKDYFDEYREKGELPPELDEHVDGKLATPQEWMDQWRHWQRAPEVLSEDGEVEIIGALDDCLVNEEGQYIPVDYKTKGYDPKKGSNKYYQTQLDLYTLMLAENEDDPKEVAEEGILVYYYPEGVGDNGSVNFGTKVVKIDTDIERVKKLIQEAIQILNGPEPDSHTECEYCAWGRGFEG